MRDTYFTVLGYECAPYDGTYQWRLDVPAQAILSAVDALPCDEKTFLALDLETDPPFQALSALVSHEQFVALKAFQCGRIRSLRAEAYCTEADGLYFGYQADGDSRDAWLRHTFAAYQLCRDTKYWLVFSGAASKDFSLSCRRENTAAMSMHPDRCETKQTTDGTTWATSFQNQTFYRRAMLNVVLQSTTNHCPQIVYGRHKGAYIPLYNGSAWVLSTIPAAGVAFDAEALTTNTKYSAYLYDNTGTLTLDLATTARVDQDGIPVKSGATGRRFLGLVGVTALQTTYCGPVDLPDARLVRNLYNQIVKHGLKIPHYVGTTYEDLKYYNGWKKAEDNNDFTVQFVSFDEVIQVVSQCDYSASTYFSLAVGIDTTRPQRSAQANISIAPNSRQSLHLVAPVQVSEGFHSSYLLVKCGGNLDSEYGRAFYVDGYGGTGYNGTEHTASNGIVLAS